MRKSDRAAGTDPAPPLGRKDLNLPDNGAQSGPAKLQKPVEALLKNQAELAEQNQDLRRRQARMGESLQRYGRLFDFAPLCFMSLDERGKIVETNQVCAERLGHTRAKLLGRSLLSFIIARDVKVFRRHLQEVFRGPGQHTCEVRFTGKDGAFYASCHSIAISAGERPLCHTVAIDITQRHTAEEGFHILVESAPLGIAVIAPGGGYKLVNSGFTKLFGYTLKEVPTGREWFTRAFPAPAYRRQVISDWKQYLEDSQIGEATLRTFVVTCKDGSEKVINFRAAHLGNGDQFIIYEDITARRQAEEALKQSEMQYRTLVEQIPAVVFKGYPDWSIDCFDRKIEDLTGYTKEDFNSRRIKWCDLIPPEEMAHVKQTFMEALQTDLSYVREHRVRKKTGDYAWVQCRGRIFLDDKGRVDYISGVTFDITAHKQADQAFKESEARYRLLADNVTDVIWVANLDLIPTYVSPSVERLFGYTPREVLTLNLADILTPASHEVAWETLREALALESQDRDSSRSFTKELEFISKSGARVWTEVKATFLRDPQGNPLGILGVARDISERKLAERSLHRRQAVLEAMRFAAEKFLENASWQTNIQEILARLGQAIEASRVYIFENHRGPDGTILASQRYEWTAPHIKPQIDNPELQNFPWQAAGFQRWEESLSQGNPIFGHVRDFPASEEPFLTGQEIKSIAVVPIFVNQQWWGFLGFDECLGEREWSVAELEALKAAASTLGAAIQHAQADQALKNSQEKLRHLSSQLLAAQEVERKRIANELHDELGHALLTLKLHLQSLERQLFPEQGGLKKEVQPMLGYIDQVIGNVRRLYLDLIPGDLEYSGLTGSIQNLIEEFAAHGKKIKWVLNLDNIDDLFSLPVQTAIFRIFQEALTNIGKHAKPSRVAITVTRNDRDVSCVIEDNGKGFAVEDIASGRKGRKSVGLVAMEERVEMMGGSFEIWSQKRRGTRISFTVPFKKRG